MLRRLFCESVYDVAQCFPEVVGDKSPQQGFHHCSVGHFRDSRQMSCFMIWSPVLYSNGNVAFVPIFVILGFHFRASVVMFLWQVERVWLSFHVLLLPLSMSKAWKMVWHLLSGQIVIPRVGMAPQWFPFVANFGIVLMAPLTQTRS